MPDGLCREDGPVSPIEQWIVQWKPTDFSFTLFVFVILIATIFILLRKIVPYLLDTKWPADQALREKRIQADIEARRDELNETRLMRQALEKLNTVASNLMLLIEQHDLKAETGFGNVISLLHLVLEKQGVEPSEIQAVLNECGGFTAEELIRQLANVVQGRG